MRSLDELIERTPSGRIALLAAIVAAIPLGGTLVLEGIADVFAITAAVAVAAGGGWLFRRRQGLLELPLEIGRHAVRDEVDGVVVVKIRARLGLGRRVRDPVVQVRFVGQDGDERPLPVVVPARDLCGAFTITATDRHRWTDRPGAIVVRIEANEAGRSWSAERRFAELRAGRFAAPVVRERGRWVHDHERWDTIAPVDEPMG